MEVPKNRRRGRPPLYGPGPAPRMFGVHINMSQDIWEAVRKHAEALGEPSLSYIARKLLRERLTQLGYLKSQVADPNMATPDQIHDNSDVNLHAARINNSQQGGTRPLTNGSRRTTARS